MMIFYDGNLDAAFEKDYFLSKEYMRESSDLLSTLTTLIKDYKSEEYILNGGSISEEEIERQKDSLYNSFTHDENNYNKYYFPKLSHEENYKKFEEVYGEKIAQIRDDLINEDLRRFNSFARKLEKYEGVLYYGTDGEIIFTNTSNVNKAYFKSFPSYLIFDKAEEIAFPEEIKENRYYYWLPYNDILERPDYSVYIAFNKEFLNPRIYDWESKKSVITRDLYLMIAFLIGFIGSSVYLLIIIGRKYMGDKEVQFIFADKLFTDINLITCFMLIASWFVSIDTLAFRSKFTQAIFPITFIIGSVGLILVLSLVKHIKNKTIIKHSLIYKVFYKLFNFIKDIFNSGSVGVKAVVIVILYPAIVALTFFIFPITIGVAVWLVLKKVKEYKLIKEGLLKVKEGELHYKINVPGGGEFAQLAADINSITEGLNKAVSNELKSERLKTELITNVSHDIRTPLTSIITYVDLLKNETDQDKVQGYIDVIDQKAQRMKILTDDLFEAAKATSGNIPVSYARIDIVSLISQGLGELNDKIQELSLDFKHNYPKEKLYVKGDGKLLWRAIENLLSNIFKYSLEGSRVYIDVEDLGDQVQLVFKNISAYELNISSEELMERFKRGDESRSSQGSGLGLSIAKSLINIQNGDFSIQIDGDLFKAIITMPKY